MSGLTGQSSGAFRFESLAVSSTSGEACAPGERRQAPSFDIKQRSHSPSRTDSRKVVQTKIKDSQFFAAFGDPNDYLLLCLFQKRNCARTYAFIKLFDTLSCMLQNFDA